MDILSFLLISYKLLLFFSEYSYASDSISSSQSLSDGRTLVSIDGTFELGFFSPGSTKSRYLGIWYSKIPVKTVVWVANRLNPINDSSGLLMINSTGYPVLISQNTSVVWSANLTKEVRSPVLLQLLDSGNFVLRDEQDGNLGTYLWQSFDYPSDTLLSEMKLGWDFKNGLERRLSAWKSPDDPSPGNFTWAVELQDYPELVMWKDSKKFYRSGPWNGLGFSGAPALKPNPVFQFNFVSNEEELYYMYNNTDKSLITRVVMNQTNYVRQRLAWSEATQSWKVYSILPKDYCDTYGLCGAYGNCMSTESPVCQCFKGFKPNSANIDWFQGCVRNEPLNYSKTDGFIRFNGLKLPDATHASVKKSMDLKECREKCLENSSCMAYTNSDIRGGGSGCAMWFGDLIDIRQQPDGGQDLYIRMSASEIAIQPGATDVTKLKIAVIIVATIAVIAGILIASYYIHKRRANAVEITENSGYTDQGNEEQEQDLELSLFELATIANATNNFSINNKLGEGGFGPVYKGILADGKEIAVKRLSKISGQGLNEFKNEVILIAKLQHRNLVKLLGCCIQEDEKLLVYEFMPNKSLDFFIFDQKNRKLLDWCKRFHIICGIARGLLYLHQDSRLRIIHRDLKASNVLLDHEMNPKISDFGLARTFGGDEIEGSTKRVVGTYGYMAPEYATDGLFSVKSDVFSFGILMLEIACGKKSRGFYHTDQSLTLVGQAWKLWNEGKPLELIDSFLSESRNPSEVTRCIHISLLCVQQHPEDRPSMSSVVLMLGSEIALPQPKQPDFLIDRKSDEPPPGSSFGKPESSSTNEITFSQLEPR
ncbi:G-type lectin S-receptor-like serine/threonine-protein kinase At4g27290 isoform X2 [Pistacia vera]|uniref:G-type lectin S-receptor-like serine/threonine-protein kinase At4g27290 isoform X2 n=1 Tax=Pistacia vera TaxID=55513 RepID=UPI001263A761|nr:G-type lectin S-receptor-like serine/threonine-protein kinase At4g27290 isoform X2 [Pistacia vera]